MRTYCVTALAGALLALLSTASRASDVGRTVGTFEVSSTGAATYSIPIWTPPGPNGVTPSISVDYNSQTGNSLLGVGWNLSATSSIERCNRTAGLDAQGAAVDLTLGDRYCINGKRLRLGSGTYGVAGSVYYTEIADYSRITAYSSTGNGPLYFIVEGKNGLKYEYGNTTNSRVLIGTTALRWMLNKVSDRNGNNYVINYINATGFAIPDTITWTPTDLGSTSSYAYEAKFNYDPILRSDTDSYLGYLQYSQLSNKKRLKNIQIKSQGTVVRKYLFDYDISSVTSMSRLTSVKECADDLDSNCFAPTIFTYQAGVAGVTPGSGSAPSGSSNNLKKGRYDLNGDGKDDLVYSSGSAFQASFAANTGFTTPSSIGITTPVVIDRFVPNGRDAIATIISGTLWIYRWDSATSSFVGYNTGIAATDIFPVDYDGDGLADLVTKSADSKSLYIRRNTSTGSGNPSFAASTFLAATLPATGPFGGTATFESMWTYFGKGLKYTDINGDGRQDFHVLIREQFASGATMYSTVVQGSSSGFTIPAASSWQPYANVAFPSINFNGDACNDRLGGSTIYISQCAGTAASTITLPAAPLDLLDWNGDGKTDFLVDGGGTFAVYLSTGTGFSSPISTTISSSSSTYAVDQDGDRKEDLIKENGTSAVSYWTHTATGSVPSTLTNLPDLLSTVTDGFGESYSPSYVSTASSNYDTGATTPFPLEEADPRIVVSQVSATDGINGSYTKSYSYRGDRFNSLRIEPAGFQQINETDSRNGLITRTYYEQSFPVAKMVSQRELIQPNGVDAITRTVVSNSFVTLDGTANNQRYLVYPSASTSTQYEVGGPLNTNLLRTVATANLYDSVTGTLYDQTITTTEPVSGANGVAPGGTWTARTYLPIANLTNDTTNWCLGRPGQVQEINSSSVPTSASITRTTSINWNPSFCRPTQIVTEPSGGALQVTTDLGYDGYGNLTSSTVTGSGMLSRTTQTSYSDATHKTGQFPLSVVNALTQETKLAWNYNLAVPISITDPNLLMTSFQYDAFGRRSREDRPDTTYTTWTYSACPPGACDPYARYAIDESLKTSGGTIYDRYLSYLDVFNRPIIDLRLRHDGTYNTIYRAFDNLGRVRAESLPYNSSPGTEYVYYTWTFDLLDRPITISRPKSDTDPTLQTTTISYEGLTTKLTDPLNMRSWQTRFASGLLGRSQDENIYYQNFDYDPFGNPIRVQDSLGNTLQNSTYNLRGMLTGRTDMDMGSWTYDPNALGEVVHVRDAKTSLPNWTQSLEYDLLGRLTKRTEAEGDSLFTYGNSSASKNIGRLSSMSGPGYSESYTYDSLARPSNTSITADSTNYQIDYSYNNFGALDTLTYPTSTSSFRLKLQFDYLNSRPYRVRECTNPACTTFGTTYWQANAYNSLEQVTSETLGNGLVSVRNIDKANGLPKSIQTGLGGGTSVQNLAYEWDLMGNIKKRKDLNQSTLEEGFTYDNLYRLLSAQLNSPLSTLSLTYDALGNISSKSDVGNYTYHSTKKHQVVSTGAPTNWSFVYDANGNMTSGRGGESIDWTSYNYPSCIRMSTSCSGTSTDYSQFSYRPDRQYWKQVANFTVGGTATTTYVGGLLEKVATTAGTDYRHMIGIGNSTIIVSRQSGGTNSVNYVTSDHLGSSSAITNSSGAILLNSSFDAFGKRRGSNWTASPSGTDWTAIASLTRRGFTEHSMLDNLGLIHMNGRVHDPWLGRFLSADPYIADPLDTQSFNRYSYVQNNPLSVVDPSGFWETRPWIPYIFPGNAPSFPQCTGGIGPPCEPGDHPEYDDPGTAQSSVSSGSIGQWSALGITADGMENRSAAQQFRDFMCSIGFGNCTPEPTSTGELPEEFRRCTVVGGREYYCVGEGGMADIYCDENVYPTRCFVARGDRGVAAPSYPETLLVPGGFVGRVASVEAKTAARGAGIVASNGTKITGLTRHGVQRAIGDAAERAGTRPQAILDALKNPKKIAEGVDSQGRPFQIFTGADARVVVNPQTGQIVSVNPLSGAGAH